MPRGKPRRPIVTARIRPKRLTPNQQRELKLLGYSHLSTELATIFATAKEMPDLLRQIGSADQTFQGRPRNETHPWVIEQLRRLHWREVRRLARRNTPNSESKHLKNSVGRPRLPQPERQELDFIANISEIFGYKPPGNEAQQRTYFKRSRKDAIDRINKKRRALRG